MKKRIVSIWLTLSILLSMIPLSVLTAFAQDSILYGDADGNDGLLQRRRINRRVSMC